ncbi:MAG: bifunctional 5,10-methylenetetrahydrofolate dehydrogenase/5,10-methenyltetrahydrofolate cyclohydrolase [Phycisphaerae bacterium]
MTANVIDGKAIAAGIRDRVSAEVAALRAGGPPPCLAAVLIGDDPAAASYARSQARHADGVGMAYRLVELDATVTLSSAVEAIERLNADPAVSGIMLQLPVPRSLEALVLQETLAPAKDVEGVGPANLGLLAMGREALVPCTAAAAYECLRSTGIDLTGREAVVVGRSAIVGKPLAMLLLNAHATVTQCHTRTRDLAAQTRRAEVLVVAAGVAGLIGAEHVRPGAVVIDVGTHRIEVEGPDGQCVKKTVGDVRFDDVSAVAAAITPVPGGVGPVTVAMLLANTAAACRRSRHDGRS